MHLDLESNFTSIILDAYGLNGQLADMKYFKVFLDAFKYTHIYQSQTNDYPFLDEAQEVMDNLANIFFEESNQRVDFRNILVLSSFLKNLISSVSENSSRPHVHFL